MNKINKEIKDKFDFFTQLVNDYKIIISKEIILNPKNNNPKWLIGKSKVKINNYEHPIFFSIEKKIKQDYKYGIKLICPLLTKEPFFRFDSDGPSHRNNYLNIPLEEQIITTPHFNTFNKDGKNLAYKNEKLKNENESKIIKKQIDKGVALFCIETNSKLSSNDYPSVINQHEQLSPIEEQIINYDKINFE